MRLLIFILALTSAFFVPNSYSNETLPEDFKHPKGELWKEVYCHMTTSYTFKGINASLEMCIEVLQPQAEKKYGWQMSQPDAKCVGSLEGQSVKFECSHYNPNGNPPSAFYYGTAKIIGEEYVYSCPPDNAPEYDSVYPYSLSEPGFVCVKSSVLPDPDLDPDCPAPTDNDPFMFGTGQQQTICFNNPDGSQCSIQTDSNGGYYMPVSYGSQEPVACNPTDPDPTDPDPTDPDPTDPDPTDPDPTDDTDQTEIIDALNQSNDNLDAINNNMVEGMDESNGLLSDILGEIESFVLGQGEGNDLLEQIANNTAEISDALNGDGEEAPECIGDICDFDSDKHYENADKEMEEWLNNSDDLQLGQEASNLMGKFTSSVSAAFAGFTGSCIPFNLEVSIRGNPHTISVGEHCSYYEDYFKPVLEWFLWVLTFIALIVVSSQSFRAFSTI